ncbi:MAG: bifunctional (p)ppGpp synthetase/guanosine-3',5'-bis(diphosphate) 3'-pyrophosphohydrolase [Anaerolineales bacterium]|nr:bifunctional (p)ppGpp synthetase/guanosine-3',5'-bis(diphosphate) 3'-pyrophosphohydrolase [Anaerolineales bacterium]
MNESIGLLLKALRFSAEKHSDQRRKDSKSSPYINHPIQVAETLWTIGEVRDTTLLVASVLHDTIEDTGTQPEEIRAEFGEEVLGLVLEVSDDKSLPRQTRKRLQVETAPHKTHNAKLLALADKICNLRDLIHSPPRRWSLARRQEYLLWTEEVVAGLRGVHEKLERCYDDCLAEGKRSLGI